MYSHENGIYMYMYVSVNTLYVLGVHTIIV